MGWSSGSRLASKLIESIEDNVEDDNVKTQLFIDLIDAFENADCDTLDECKGESAIFDAIWDDKYPDDEWDEDED